MESNTRQWYDQYPVKLREMFNNETTGAAHGHKRFDVMMPAVNACNLQRIGGEEGDGSKFICGLTDIPQSLAQDKPKCTVYSLGSNGNYLFEEDVIARTPCNIEIFDCIYEGKKDLPPHLKARARWHDICVGAPENSRGRYKFMRLKDIMKMLGHESIHLLKMDIEGSEYDVFDDLLSDLTVSLPEQIAFELHTAASSPVSWRQRKMTPGEIGALAERLYLGGYRVLSRENNDLCDDCVEYTLARFFCDMH